MFISNIIVVYNMKGKYEKSCHSEFITFKRCLGSLSNGTASIIEHLIDVHLIGRTEEIKYC